MRTANDFITQILPFQILEPENWLEIDKMARIRIENIVAESIEEGECLARSNTINGAGALATWAKEFLPRFGITNKIISILSKKLQGQYEDQLYVFSFFLTPLPELFNIKPLSSKCIKNICNAVKNEQDFVCGGLRTILEEEFWTLPDEWQTIIIEFLPEFKKFDIDDIPF